MDYKAKYEEALERAKRWADGTLQPERTTPQGVCEAIFPELAESEDEDEKIRKFLIDLLSCGIWKEEWPFTPPECVEYLEKQKDSIPYEKYVEDIAAIHAEARTKYHAGWNEGYEAKQKEQKHELAEDEDERIRKTFVAILELFGKDEEWYGIPVKSVLAWLEKMSEENIKKIRSEEYTKGYTDAIKANEKWQKEQKPESASASIMIPSCWEEKKKEQKYIGLSKADKLFLQDVADVLGDNEYKDAAKRLRDLSKSLYLQPKAEWSEEDEIRRERCMLYLANMRDCIESSQFIGDNARESSKKEIQKEIDWLKSLRPQPKKKTIWHRAKAGTLFTSEALVIGDDGEARLSKVAVNDCWYILVKKLLPGEDEK